MKRIVSVLLLLVFALTLAACASTPVSESPSPETDEEKPSETLKLWVCKSATWYNVDGSVDTVETFAYDKWGNRNYTKVESELMDGAEKPYYKQNVSEYDEAGRLLSKCDSELYKADDSLLSKTQIEYRYNEAGLLVREDEQELSYDGKETACYRVYSYDENDRLVKMEEMQTAPEEFCSMVVEYSYSESSEREFTAEYKWENGAAVSKSQTTSIYYPTKEKPDRTKTTSSSASSSYEQEILYTYNEDGKVLKEISTNTMYLASGASMGETQWTKEYEYGETLGKVVKETTYYNGELSSTTTYEHDEYGNWKSQYRRNGYGELSRHADYIYEEIEVEPKTEQ